MHRGFLRLLHPNAWKKTQLSCSKYYYTKPTKKTKPIPDTQAPQKHSFHLTSDFQSGIELLNQNKVPEALEKFEISSKNSPLDLVIGKYHSALCFLVMGDYKGAIRMLSQAQIPSTYPPELSTIISSYSVVIPYQMGIAYFSLQDWQSALKCMDAAVEQDPKFGVAHFYRALSLFELQNFPGCMLAIDQAMSMDQSYCEKVIAFSSPGDIIHNFTAFTKDEKLYFSTLLERKAYCLMETDQPVLAIETIDEVLRIEPTNVRILVYRASLYFHQEAYEKCLQDVETILKIEPENFEAILLKVRVCTHHTGKREEALTLCEMGLSVQPHSLELLTVKSLILFEAEKYDECIQVSQQILSFDEMNVDANYLMAGALAWKGKFGDCIPFFDKVLQVQPDHVDALYSKACSHLSLGQLSIANKVLKTLVSVDPLNDKARAMIEFIQSNDSKSLAKTFGIEDVISKDAEAASKLTQKILQKERERMMEAEDREANPTKYQDETIETESVKVPKKKLVKKLKKKTKK